MPLGRRWLGLHHFPPEAESEDAHSRLYDRCGVVFTDPADPMYIGAELHSSISSEPYAVMELLWHTLHWTNQGMFKDNKHLIVFVDCIYVKDVLLWEITVATHPLLASLA